MSAPSNTITLIHKALTTAFSPTRLEIVDESHLHAGHAGAQSGKGHYAISIASTTFAGKTPIAKHRMVYEALGTLMQTHIHALSIKAEIE